MDMIEKPLKNTRHEAFAQYLSEGESQLAAYKKAGYKPQASQACNTAKHPDVVARVAYLQHRRTKQGDITVERLTEMLLDDRERCVTAEENKAAADIVMHIAKLRGLVTNKQEIDVREQGPVNQLTDDMVERRLRELQRIPSKLDS